MSSDNLMKQEFRRLERNVLILIIIPLTLFSFSYLYTTGDTIRLSIPQLPLSLSPVLLWIAIGLLFVQHFSFRSRIRVIGSQEKPVSEKLKAYAHASINRFYVLFVVGILSAVGILFFRMPGFTITYAVCLVFISLGKPSPERIVRGLKLKGEEKDLINSLNRREDP